MVELITSSSDTTFYVHQYLFIRHSHTSGAEYPSQKIDLQAWGNDTISRLVQFLYFGKYDMQNPDLLYPSEDLNEKEHPDTDKPHDATRGCGSYYPRPQPDEDRYYLLYPQETHDYGAVLLGHAKLYDLARCLEIKALMQMACKRLKVILHNLEPVPRSRLSAHIVDLLCFVYTYNFDVPSSILAEPMREMVLQFAVTNFAAVGCTEKMKGLLKLKRELARDILRGIGMGLGSAEDKFKLEATYVKMYYEELRTTAGL